jgi:phage head maturation protease
MQAKFAKAFARNIRVIAQETARIALIDHEVGPTGEPMYPQARVEAWKAIEKAEDNIAALLQQPGAFK